MGHKPKTMSEIYSPLFEEIDMRLAEAKVVGSNPTNHFLLLYSRFIRIAPPFTTIGITFL
jgi:hypothetical protein